MKCTHQAYGDQHSFQVERSKCDLTVSSTVSVVLVPVQLKGKLHGITRLVHKLYM